MPRAPRIWTLRSLAAIVLLLGCPLAVLGGTLAVDARRDANSRARLDLVSLVHSAERVVLPATAAPALAASIRYSRRQAVLHGAKPIPPRVRRALEPYYPGEVLDSVRWTTPGRRVGLGTIVAGWYYREGAVTLNDVIVFSDRRSANNAGLWAHELTHVLQYRALGVDGFARRYVTDWASLEEQAMQNSRTVRLDRELRARSRPGRRQAIRAPEREIVLPPTRIV